MLAGPSLAGILLTSLVDGKAGFRELLSRLFRWRVGIRWYAVALLAAPLVSTAAQLALSLTSPVFRPGMLTTSDKASLLLPGVAAGLMVGIFEDLGWTGFAIPRLRLSYGVVTTRLIVGLLWGAWHFLLFWESGSFSGALLLALLLGRLFSWLPAFRVLMVWLYDHTGSLLLAMLMHASLVATQLILFASGHIRSSPLDPYPRVGRGAVSPCCRGRHGQQLAALATTAPCARVVTRYPSRPSGPSTTATGPAMSVDGRH